MEAPPEVHWVDEPTSRKQPLAWGPLIVGIFIAAVLILGPLAIIFEWTTPKEYRRGGRYADPPATSPQSSGRGQVHRAFCEQLVREEPRRLIGYASHEAFVEDCVAAQFEYDREFGEDAP